MARKRVKVTRKRHGGRQEECMYPLGGQGFAARFARASAEAPRKVLALLLIVFHSIFSSLRCASRRRPRFSRELLKSSTRLIACELRQLHDSHICTLYHTGHHIEGKSLSTKSTGGPRNSEPNTIAIASMSRVFSKDHPHNITIHRRSGAQPERAPIAPRTLGGSRLHPPELGPVEQHTFVPRVMS